MFFQSYLTKKKRNMKSSSLFTFCFGLRYNNTIVILFGYWNQFEKSCVTLKFKYKFLKAQIGFYFATIYLCHRPLKLRYLFCVPLFGSSKSLSTSSNLVEHALHLQQTMHGAANNSRGDATNNKMPKLAKIPITCALCHTTDAREWPNLFLHGPLS